jgi:hypothetical protein
MKRASTNVRTTNLQLGLSVGALVTLVSWPHDRVNLVIVLPIVTLSYFVSELLEREDKKWRPERIEWER